MNVKLDPGAKLPTRAHDLDAGWLNCECPVCGKRFHLKPCAVKRFKTHYCSKGCQNEARKNYMKGAGNHQYGLKCEKNASWKGDSRKATSYGYIMARDFNHPSADKQGWVFEHRLVAEKYLLNDENSVEINGGKYLKPGYEVHHKNFDRQDNRPENLEVLTHGDHKRLHIKLNQNSRDSLGRYASSNEIIKVKRLSETAIIPERKSVGAAGYDLFVDSNAEIIIPPHETVMLQSNIAFEIPKGYFGAIYARSGIAARMGLRPATCVSVIDSDYRGSVGLPTHNDSTTTQVVLPHERVAQIVFQKAFTPDLELVDSLDDTERGENGFGSTGR